MTELSSGCKVVCINDAEDSDFEGSCVWATPVKGKKYTVSRVFPGAQVISGVLKMCDCVLLQELSNADCGCLRFGLMPLGFFAWRFAVEESHTIRQLREAASRQPASGRVPEEVDV